MGRNRAKTLDFLKKMAVRTLPRDPPAEKGQEQNPNRYARLGSMGSGVREHPRLVTKRPQNWSAGLILEGNRRCKTKPVDLERYRGQVFAFLLRIATKCQGRSRGTNEAHAETTTNERKNNKPGSCSLKTLPLSQTRHPRHPPDYDRLKMTEDRPPRTPDRHPKVP